MPYVGPAARRTRGATAVLGDLGLHARAVDRGPARSSRGRGHRAGDAQRLRLRGRSATTTSPTWSSSRRCWSRRTSSGGWCDGSPPRRSSSRSARLLVTREAVRAERDRIARELHDVIAHSVSAMVVQTAAAQDLVRTDPDRAERVLRDVADTGRRALVETGRLLHVIRDDADELGLNPAPGVADLDRLVQEFRAEGLDVDLSVDDGLAPAACRDRRLGVPDRAGGADQRPALRRRDRDAPGHRDRGRRRHPGHQPDRPHAPLDGLGAGTAWPRRAGGAARWHAHARELRGPLRAGSHTCPWSSRS